MQGRYRPRSDIAEGLMPWLTIPSNRPTFVLKQIRRRKAGNHYLPNFNDILHLKIVFKRVHRLGTTCCWRPLLNVERQAGTIVIKPSSTLAVEMNFEIRSDVLFTIPLPYFSACYSNLTPSAFFGAPKEVSAAWAATQISRRNQIILPHYYPWMVDGQWVLSHQG